MLIDQFKRLCEVITPLHFDWIQVEISAVCNASCPYCVLNCYKGERPGGLMDMETFEHLEPSFKNADLLYLQGWGEPLVHPRFWDMVRRVKSSGAKVGFTTNGILLSPENLSMLLQTNVDIMGISLAGTSRTTNERFRKGCDLEGIDRSLRELKRMKEARPDAGTRVHLAFMLLCSNRHELRELPGLAHEWGVSQIVVSNLSLVASREMEDESILVHPELWQEAIEALEAAKRDATEKGIEFHYYRPDVGEPCQVCKENVLRSCVVSYRGDVTPCVMANINAREGSEAMYYFQNQGYPVEQCIFGNINELPLRDIWNSTKAREFRAGFEKRLTTEHPGMSYLPDMCGHWYKLLER